MILVHEDRTSDSLISKPLAVDIDDLVSFRPPTIREKVKIRFGETSLETFRLNVTFGDEPSLPMAWRHAEEPLPDELLYDVKGEGVLFFFSCNWAVTVVAVTWLAMLAIVLLKLYRGRQLMKVEHRGKQEEEEDGEDKKKQEDEHEMKGGTEQDQLNRGENMDDDSVVLKNIGTSYNTTSDANLAYSPQQLHMTSSSAGSMV